MAQLTELSLQGNKIGDAGVTALAGACASGALAKLTTLGLNGNKIGDPGCTALARRPSRGAERPRTEMKSLVGVECGR